MTGATSTGDVLTINGTGLFVDVRGPKDAPPLLFVHGGPGQGSYDFMHAQGDRLAERLRVVGVDQRGVLRSDPLPTGAPLNVQVLLEDFEALRQELGIDSWTILGHSAGGGYAIRYAHQYPASVHAAIYDCPCWDCAGTDRYRLPIAADLLERYGELKAARRCRELAAKPERLNADDQTWAAMRALGKRYNELFFHQPDNTDALDRIGMQSGLSEDQWRRGVSHLPLLTEMYESKLDLLPELSQPSLLVHGRHDLVIPPGDVQAFRDGVPNGRVHTFERSGHFAYIEEPDEYTAVVTDFVLSAHR